jgi:hypothetical protein
MIVDRSADSKIATFKCAGAESRSRRRTLDLEIASSTAGECVAIPRLTDLAFGKRKHQLPTLGEVIILFIQVRFLQATWFPI